MKLYKNGLIILLLVCLAGTVAFYSVRAGTQQKLNENIAFSLELNAEAQELLSQGEFAGARELLEDSLSLNRLNDETYALLAFAEYYLDNHRQAYEHFISGLAMGATSRDMVKFLAEMLMENGYYAEAKKYLASGLKDFPDDEKLLFLSGKNALISGDFKGSIKTFKKLLKEDEDFLVGYKYLGLSYYFADDLEKAEGNYKKYLKRKKLLDEIEKLSVDLLHEKVLAVWSEDDE